MKGTNGRNEEKRKGEKRTEEELRKEGKNQPFAKFLISSAFKPRIRRRMDMKLASRHTFVKSAPL